MSTDSVAEIILTATVAIFSPDMRKVIAVINDKLRRIVPPGGRFESEKDPMILDTAKREVKEEIGIILTSTVGVFLDKVGNPTGEAEIIQSEPFTFINDPSQRGLDTLYFFRLHEDPGYELRAEKVGFWLAINQVLREELEMGGETYGVFFPRMKDAIERVMKY